MNEEETIRAVAKHARMSVRFRDQRCVDVPVTWQQQTDTRGGRVFPQGQWSAVQLPPRATRRAVNMHAICEKTELQEVENRQVQHRCSIVRAPLCAARLAVYA